MAKGAKRIICLFSSLIIIFSHCNIYHAEALPDLLSGSTTIADIVLTYMATAGCAVTNTDWINTLTSSLGSQFGTIESFVNQGYLVQNVDGVWEPVQALGDAIEQTAAYSDLGLGDIFNISAQEAAAGGGLAAASGGSILAGATGCVASHGILPVLGGVTAAYWGGIALGTIIAHAIGLYGKSIDNGTPISIDDFLNNVLPNGNSCVYYGFSSNKLAAYGYGNLYALGYNLSNGMVDIEIISYVRNLSDNSSYKKHVDNLNNSTDSDNGYINFQSGVGSIVSIYVYSGNNPFAIPMLKFNNNTERNNFINGLKTGVNSLPEKYSPDLIGQDGNLESDRDQQGNITVPDMLPQIDPSREAAKPVSITDWLNFANQAKTNTAAGDKGSNKDLFNDFIDDIKTVLPSPAPNPYPDPNPNPNPNPVPDPDYDPDPEGETQPDWENETSTQETGDPVDPIDGGKPWVVQGLQNKFPFCIPWDIKNCFSKLNSGSREAPRISWHFNPNSNIDYTFELDLEDFEAVATLLRTLELIAFIVGLAFATRYLIGAT